MQINKVDTIDDIGVILVGIFSLGYCVFVRRFAKLIIDLPGISFPVFIGEVCLVICLSLFLLKWAITPHRFRLWHGVLIGYCAFVLIKAFYGYAKWGPLAFRHAALFYYPLFAIFGYNFYRHDFFNTEKIFLLLLTFIIMFAIGNYYPYATFTCFVLAAILTAKLFGVKHRALQYFIILLFLFVGAQNLFFQGGRALLLTNIISSLFIILIPFFILNIRFIHRVIVALSLTCIFLLGVFGLADKMVLRTATNFKQTMHIYNLYNNMLLKEKSSFNMTKANQIRIYNKEDDEYVGVQTEGDKKTYIYNKVPVPAGVMRQNRIRAELAKIDSIFLQPSGKGDLKEGRYLRDLDSATTNSVFRIFVWKDLLEDINREKRLLGFDFGKPFRSKNIEILYLASGEWERDGWVAAHNSYLELIYRAGIVGVIFILVLFTILFRMIWQAVYLKSLKGILLCGALINWLLVSICNVILEMPYNAIPFWFLFGMSCAYLFKDRIEMR